MHGNIYVTQTQRVQLLLNCSEVFWGAFFLSLYLLKDLQAMLLE